MTENQYTVAGDIRTCFQVDDLLRRIQPHLNSHVPVEELAQVMKTVDGWRERMVLAIRPEITS